MTEQEYKRQTRESRSSKDGDIASISSEVDAEKVRNDIDALLDEIDEVLEGNAEEFVRNYIQKGGE